MTGPVDVDGNPADVTTMRIYAIVAHDDLGRPQWRAVPVDQVDEHGRWVNRP